MPRRNADLDHLSPRSVPDWQAPSYVNLRTATARLLGNRQIRESFPIVHGRPPELRSKMGRPAPKKTPAKIGGARRKANRSAVATPTRYQPFRSCANRPQRFHFFTQLPTELRLAVYALLLTSNEAIDPVDIWTPPPSFSTLGLLRANKTIGAEAAGVLYGNNTFTLLERCDDHVTDKNNLSKNECMQWLAGIGDKNASFLRNIQVRIRLERPATYYSKMFKEIVDKANNITRLCLVGERHANVRAPEATSGYGTRWEPNKIDPVSLHHITKIKPSLDMLNLGKLILGGNYDIELLNLICIHLGCRVQVISSKAAERTHTCVVLWNKAKHYDVAPSPDGREAVHKIREEDKPKNNNRTNKAKGPSSYQPRHSGGFVG